MELVVAGLLALVLLGGLASLVRRPRRGRRNTVEEASASEALHKEQEAARTDAIDKSDRLNIRH